MPYLCVYNCNNKPLAEVLSGLNSMIMTLVTVLYMLGPSQKIRYVFNNCLVGDVV